MKSEQQVYVNYWAYTIDGVELSSTNKVNDNMVLDQYSNQLKP